MTTKEKDKDPTRKPLVVDDRPRKIYTLRAASDVVKAISKLNLLKTKKESNGTTRQVSK